MADFTWGSLFTYYTCQGSHYEGCEMLVPGYPSVLELCVDIDSHRGLAYVWYIDGRSRIDYEPIRLGQDSKSTIHFKTRPTVNIHHPWEYEW